MGNRSRKHHYQGAAGFLHLINTLELCPLPHDDGPRKGNRASNKKRQLSLYSTYFFCYHRGMQKYMVKQFDAQFPNDDACLDFLKNARWPDGVDCSKCDRVTNHYRIRGRKVYGCEFCGSHVSPTADTIFHKSATPLRSWFHAIFLMASTRDGHIRQAA